MGSVNSVLNQISVQETQVAQINQSCKQTDIATLTDENITIINSTVGNITFTNSLQVNNLDCMLTSTIQNVADTTISSVTKNVNKDTWPIDFTSHTNTVTNIANISSFQQAISDQACNQALSVDTQHNSLTIIDSVTGNIVIASQAVVNGQSCNLAASTYQMAVNQATNDSDNENSTGCFLSDLGMCLPILGAALAVPLVIFLSKSGGGAGGMPGMPGGSGGESSASQLLESAEATNLLEGGSISSLPKAPADASAGAGRGAAGPPTAASRGGGMTSARSAPISTTSVSVTRGR